jgi:hypothetical protein
MGTHGCWLFVLLVKLFSLENFKDSRIRSSVKSRGNIELSVHVMIFFL